MAETFLYNISIEVEEAERTAQSIQSAELQPIAEAFFRNAHNLLDLLSLPKGLLLSGIARGQQSYFYARALVRVRTKNTGKWSGSEQDLAEVDTEMKRLTEQAKKDPESASKLFAEAEEQFTYLIKNKVAHEAVRVLLSTSCSFAWAAFECAVKDAWIVAVNARPLKLGQATFAKLSDESPADGLSAKQIAVGLLARHGFDLRDKLGTLLAPKFDFTSIAGIRDAYRGAFGVRPELAEALNSAALATLEVTRHLIVHRAGFVDEEYRRRTGDTTAIGQQLHLNGARVSELTNASILAGCKLLRAVDAWLLANPAITRD